MFDREPILISQAIAAAPDRNDREARVPARIHFG